MELQFPGPGIFIEDKRLSLTLRIRLSSFSQRAHSHDTAWRCTCSDQASLRQDLLLKGRRGDCNAVTSAEATVRRRLRRAGSTSNATREVAAWKWTRKSATSYNLCVASYGFF